MSEPDPRLTPACQSLSNKYTNMFGELSISQLTVGTSTLSFLVNTFVIARLFCGTGLLQYSDGYEYPRTFIEHQIPKNVDTCLIRLKDKLGNTYTKLITIK